MRCLEAIFKLQFYFFLHFLDSFVDSDSEILQSENILETGQLPNIKRSVSTLDELMDMHKSSSWA